MNSLYTKTFDFYLKFKKYIFTQSYSTKSEFKHGCN